MKFGNYLTYLREKNNLSKKAFADKLHLSPGYILNVEKGRNAPPSPERLEEFSNILNLNTEERNKLFWLAFEEKVKEKNQQWFMELAKSPEEFKQFTKLEYFEEKDEPPLITLTALYKESSLENSKYKGVNMLRTTVDDLENDPKFEKGDVITIKIDDSEIHDEKFFAFRDLGRKRMVLRQVRKYKDSIILRNYRSNIEDEFDLNRFQVVGRIIKHSREL